VINDLLWQGANSDLLVRPSAGPHLSAEMVRIHTLPSLFAVTMKSSFLRLLALGAVAGTLTFGPEAWRAALVFDRAGLALGEWWRLWTGHLVHFSAAHLGANLLGLGVVAVMSGLRRDGAESAPRPRAWLWGGMLIAPPLLSLALFALEPAMHTYGGLSGLVCGLLTFTALELIAAPAAAGPMRGARIWGAALLVVIAMKSVGDLLAQSFSFVAFDSTADVRVSAWAHAAGALLGLVFFLSRPRRKSCPLPPAGALAS
jgi:rhomboid family GlyGly-CTERM serine protease